MDEDRAGDGARAEAHLPSAADAVITVSGAEVDCGGVGATVVQVTACGRR